MRLPILSRLKGSKKQEEKPSPVSTPDSGSDAEREGDGYDDSPVQYLTWRTLILGVLASMGGFIFGYSTGQISGFMPMKDFSMRFGELNEDTGTYAFSNVRSGLIVGLVSCFHPFIESVANIPQSSPLEP
jgi:SP family sugar:H+ symporter-like MFS transporter